jgi:hypothetical protein
MRVAKGKINCARWEDGHFISSYWKVTSTPSPTLGHNCSLTCILQDRLKDLVGIYAYVRLFLFQEPAEVRLHWSDELQWLDNTWSIFA